jgi:hypothetical protein
MAKNTKNKYPAEKTGTKYSEFRNTKRLTPGKVRATGAVKPGTGTPQGDTPPMQIDSQI